MSTRLSKSQLSTWVDCPRKWHNVYRLGIRPPPNTAAKAGLVVHKRLEDWRAQGVVPDADEIAVIDDTPYRVGAIANAMIEQLPPLGTEGIATERRVEFSIDGIDYVAIEDWSTDEILGDYKTTKNLRWALTKNSIKSDIQVLVSSRYRDRDTMLWWTYGTTGEELKTKKLKLQITRDEIRSGYDKIVLPLATQVLDMYDSGREAEPNYNSCAKYGGCPFKNTEHCVSVSIFEKIKKPGEIVPSINPPVVAAVADSEVSVPTNTAKPIRTLYLDCLPLKGNVVHATELITAASQTVCNDVELPHVMLAEFSRGGAMLATQIRVDVLAREPGFDLFLVTRTPEGRAVQQELMSLAENVVMAL